MDGVSAALNFLVVKDSPVNVMIGVPNIKNLRGKLDYQEEVFRVKISEKIISLPLDPYVSKYRLVKSGTDSEDFTSDT